MNSAHSGVSTPRWGEPERDHALSDLGALQELADRLVEARTIAGGVPAGATTANQRRSRSPAGSRR